MVPGRRRVRYIALLFVFILAALVYFRRRPDEHDGGVVAEEMVGGGAVLRKETVQEPTQVAPVTKPSVAVNAGQAVHQSTHASTRIGQAAGADGGNPSSSSGAFVPAATRPPVVPAADGDPREKVLPTKVDQDSNIVPTSSIDAGLHWTAQPEHFPVSSTAQLPTGSPKAIPKIQYEGKDAGRADRDRLALIKAATRHAWNGYRDAAFGADEVRPITGRAKNPFNGWGATLVDSLDTLWIMGMVEEFDEAVEAVRKIDFTTSNQAEISLFETTIRYLGGLLAAYDISGKQGKYQILLDQAVQLADMLYGAFDTPNRMPQTRYVWKPASSSELRRAGDNVVLAEIGSLSLEFTRLAQMTGEPKYYDAIARITDALDVWQNDTRVPGMWPMALDASGCKKSARVTGHKTQKLAPDDNTAMEAAEPVSQHNEEKVLSPGETAALWTKPHKAQAERQGLEHVVSSEGSSLDTASHQQLANEELGATKSRPKRQLDHISDNEEHPPVQNDSAQSKQDLQPDTKTGQDMCLPRGLASVSEIRDETYTLGGQSDSTYEYFPKEYLLLGGRVDQYRTMYESSADAAIKHLIFRPMTPEGLDILVSGALDVHVNRTTDKFDHNLRPVGEHLACFAGGMFAMGGKVFNRPDDVDIGRKLTEGCIWSYNATTTGIMPEIFTLMKCEGRTDAQCQWDEEAYLELMDPQPELRRMNARLFDADTAAASLSAETANQNHQKREDANGNSVDGDRATLLKRGESAEAQQKAFVASDHSARPQSEPSTAAPNPGPIEPSRTTSEPNHKQPEAPGFSPTSSGGERTYRLKPPLSQKEFVKNRAAEERLPPGFVSFHAKKYILRPEAIESVFYMYRITGEEYWREAGWKMFVAIDASTKTLYGNAAIVDVSSAAPILTDSMESFWIAETLKYLYLLFDDPETWSLDDWVLNTEAHFFRRPSQLSDG